jgi:hypothetical protein
MVAAFLFEGASGQTPARMVKPESPPVVLWKARKPAIEKILDSDALTCQAGGVTDVVDAFGENGDELSVALVDYCHGGAYSDWIVALRLEHGQPVFAEFRDAKGKRIENGFTSGASVLHSTDVKLAAEKKAIYDLFADNDAEGRLARCGVKAYVWNARTRTFDLDLLLSKVTSNEYCSSLRVRR